MQLTNEQILAMARMLVEQQPTAAEKEEKSTRDGFLAFTNKEILKMPKNFRNQFIIDGRRVRYRERIDRNSYSCEIRYRRDGYNISVSATTIEGVKAKFIQKLNEAANAMKGNEVPRNLKEFTEYYFNKFRSRKVAAETLKNDKLRANRYIFPTLGNLDIKKINSNMCQSLIDDIVRTGKEKTAEDIHTLLNVIFKMAIRHNLITNNPMDIIIRDKHERKHGKALTRLEEEALLNHFSGTEYRLHFAVALYTGMRPNEFSSAKLSEDRRFIVCINSKRKGGKVEYKRIPVTPMLAPYLDGVEVLRFPHTKNMTNRVARFFNGKHKLYDLRTTFYTRCQECGVAPAARDEFVGHSSSALSKTYTDLSDDFLYTEGQKLKY